jgi:Flp pilus assembly pilin Flp
MNPIEFIRHWRPLQRFLHSERGVAAVEFALTIPIWATLLLGATDGSYCLVINERTDRIAYTVGNIVTTQQSVSKAQLATIMQAGAQVMNPFPFVTQGVIITTSIYKPAGKSPVVEWQYIGGGGLARASKIGTTGGTPILPNGLTLSDNDNVITSEVYYVFTPMFVKSGLFGAGDVYRVAIFKPRLSQLTTPPT